MVAMLIHYMAPIMFASLVIFLLLGYPVAFSLAANGLIFGLIPSALAARQSPVDALKSGSGREPLPFPGNGDWDHLVFLTIDRVDHRSCRTYRHFVFTRPSAKNYSYAELLRQINTPRSRNGLKNCFAQCRQD